MRAPRTLVDALTDERIVELEEWLEANTGPLCRRYGFAAVIARWAEIYAEECQEWDRITREDRDDWERLMKGAPSGRRRPPTAEPHRMAACLLAIIFEEYTGRLPGRRNTED